MYCQPRILLNRDSGKPKISVILLDWGVRESFHSLHYLNRQTADRRDYELIWLEFYDRRPEALGREAAALDKWVVLGYPDDLIYHKHRLYNLGILASRGEVCVICDSDAVFRPTFVESLIRAFEETPRAVVHVDEVRNEDPRFYPFRYPEIGEIVGEGCINWHETTTRGLVTDHDRLHRANYGACMAARREDMLAVGGADEHLDYLGYICGPYDMTFRLANYGRPERWLGDEFLYHVWHPNQSGINTDHNGPHDGGFMSLRALDARTSFRVRPRLPNPWVRHGRRGKTPELEELLRAAAARPEPTWRADAQTAGLPDDVYWVVRDYRGFNIFNHKADWFAVPEREGTLDPRRARNGGYQVLLRGESPEALREEIDAHVGETPAGPRGPLGRLMKKFQSQPLRRLPGRVWRKARQLVEAARPPQPPWTTRSSPAEGDPQ